MSTQCDLPVLDESECTGCGICVPACPQEALVIANGVIRLVPNEDCSYCGECEAACPTGAISCPYEIVFEGEA